MRSWAAAGAVVVAALLAAPGVRAESAESAGRPEEAFDLMNVLSNAGLHDLNKERWNAYGQLTSIVSYKAPFRAAYTNLGGSNGSLKPEAEVSYTASATLYLGVRVAHGTELYFAPEAVSLRALSNLRGLGGAIQNFELQKTGTMAPQFYHSRAYVQQTFDLGGTPVEKTSDPLQVAGKTTSRRLTVQVGNFSVTDFMDKNSFAGDLRQQFFNMAFLTYAAYDFAADARGFGWGVAAQLVLDDWSIRLNRMTPPKDPNSLSVDFNLAQHYGDQVEVEHVHSLGGLAGAVRVLAYRNQVVTGAFRDAVNALDADPNKNAANCGDNYNYGSENPTAPDLCWVRRQQHKVGIGLNLEQHLTEDAGVFFRGMWSDGRTEVYAFGPTDRSIAFGALSKGGAWGRPRDVTGLGLGFGWISDEHAEYLRRGGVDGFVGDGTLRQGVENVAEAFYSVCLANVFWLSADYQHITNPAYNRDRGPVDIVAGRLHVEF